MNNDILNSIMEKMDSDPVTAGFSEAAKNNFPIEYCKDVFKRSDAAADLKIISFISAIENILVQKGLVTEKEFGEMADLYYERYINTGAEEYQKNYREFYAELTGNTDTDKA